MDGVPCQFPFPPVTGAHMRSQGRSTTSTVLPSNLGSQRIVYTTHILQPQHWLCAQPIGKLTGGQAGTQTMSVPTHLYTECAIIQPRQFLRAQYLRNAAETALLGTPTCTLQSLLNPPPRPPCAHLPVHHAHHPAHCTVWCLVEG
jgi:hypothetical protein